MILPVDIIEKAHPLFLNPENSRQMDVQFGFDKPNYAFFFDVNNGSKIIAPEEGKIISIERNDHFHDLSGAHETNYIVIENNFGTTRIEHINPGLYVGRCVSEGEYLGEVYGHLGDPHVHMYTFDKENKPRKIVFKEIQNLPLDITDCVERARLEMIRDVPIEKVRELFERDPSFNKEFFSLVNQYHLRLPK